MGLFESGSLVGLGRAMARERSRREERESEELRRKDAEDRAHYESILQHIEKIASDPNAHPDSRTAASRAFFDLTSRGRKDTKPKDREEAFTSIGRSAQQRRQQEILGLKKTGEQASSMNAGQTIPPEVMAMAP